MNINATLLGEIILIPPLGLIYLAALVLKKDINHNIADEQAR